MVQLQALRIAISDIRTFVTAIEGNNSCYDFHEVPSAPQITQPDSVFMIRLRLRSDPGLRVCNLNSQLLCLRNDIYSLSR